MGLTGNLRTMELPDLLQMLAQGRSTGTLWVSNGTVEKSIFFQDGAVVSSASSDPREYLGHFLVSHGFLTEEQLAEAIAEQQERRALLGQILVDRGLIDQADLEMMLVLKSEESLFELFSWPAGEFRFLDGELPEWEMVPISLGVQGLLLEGMQRQDEWGRIRERIPSARAVPVAMTDLVDDPKLSDRDRAILALVDDDRTVGEIGMEAHTSEFHVCRVLYHELERGRVKVVRARTEAGGDPDVAPGAEALLGRARDLLEDGRYQRALRHLRAATSLAPDRGDLRSTARQLEKQLAARLHGEGIAMSSVPEPDPAAAPADAGLSPEEGFVLSRIDGRSRVESILAISPLPELEALVTLWKLRRAGMITIGE